MIVKFSESSTVYPISLCFISEYFQLDALILKIEFKTLFAWKRQLLEILNSLS